MRHSTTSFFWHFFLEMSCFERLIVAPFSFKLSLKTVCHSSCLVLIIIVLRVCILPMMPYCVKFIESFIFYFTTKLSPSNLCLQCHTCHIQSHQTSLFYITFHFSTLPSMGFLSYCFPHFLTPPMSFYFPLLL